MKSIDSGVCHKLWSILLWIVRACLLTIKYQVVQFLPSISILEQYETCDNSPTDFISSSLKWWSSMHGVICGVAESSCLPTHNIVPHTSLHDQPCHKTMKKYEYFERMVTSLIPPAENRDSNMVL